MGSLYCDLSATPWRLSSELLIQCTIQIQHNYGNRDRAETDAAIERQNNKKGKFKTHIQSEKGQYRFKIYKRAESMIPQLDGTYNVSDSSNTDSHDYLDLASTNIIQYRTRGQKQRQKANEMADANRHSAHIEYIKPNTRIRTKRQKVPDDEDIDIDKIVKDDTPRHDRKRATEIERQLKEKEAERLALEKAKQLQIEKDIKEKEAKRLALEKGQIEALIAKYKPHKPKTPDEVDTSGTGKNANIDGKEGTRKGKPPHKKTTKASQIKTSQNKGDKANKSNSDTLLGDPMVNTKKGTYKINEKGQKNTIDINDIGIC